MKRRITALVLVVVMLALTLVSCGYSFVKDDMSQYVNFDKTEFAKAILALEIEDGEYTTDKATRKEKIVDYVYEILLEKVDSTDKKTTGKIGERDKFYYCYYVTAVIEGVEHAFLTSNMKESSALSLQFGNTSTDGYKALLEAQFKDVELTADNVYKTLTSGTAKKDDIAFISYTKSYIKVDDKGAKLTVEDTIDNEMVKIGDSKHEVASQIADKSIATTLSNITKGEGDAKVTYSNIKINWVASKFVEKTFTEVTYTEEKKLESANDGKEYDLKDKALTYHAFPVYYLEVEDYNAKTILKTLITELIHDEDDGHDHEEESIYALPSFEKFLDEVKDVIAKEEALNGNGLKADEEGYIQGAAAAYEAAKSAKEKAEEALETVEQQIEDAKKDGGEPTETQLAAKKQAEEALNGNGLKPDQEGYIKGAKAEFTEAETAKKNAEAAYDKAVDTLIAKIGEDKIKEEYEVDIHETLLAEYNAEIKKNLATELWELIQDNTKDKSIDKLPAKAVENAYERIYSRYQYLFYNGNYDDGNSSTTNDPSNYSHYQGVFEEYLRAETKTSTFEDAKAEVMKQAKEHVLISVTVFAAAEAYELTLTKDEVKDINRPGNDYLVEYYGEENVQTAKQFDKLLNFFLETEEEADKDTGVDVYKNVKYTTKKA